MRGEAPVEPAAEPPRHELVFRALADGHRRALLDALFVQDGQPLADLCAALPHLSRFGVMKHLKVLEEASLVTTRRVGRQKLHYLNPVPIREIHDRWISKYAARWVDVLTGIRDDLERPAEPGRDALEPPATA